MSEDLTKCAMNKFWNPPPRFQHPFLRRLGWFRFEADLRKLVRDAEREAVSDE